MYVYILRKSYDYEAEEILGIYSNDKFGIEKQKEFVEEHKKDNPKDECNEFCGEERGNPFTTIKVGNCAFVLQRFKVEKTKGE